MLRRAVLPALAVVALAGPATAADPFKPSQGQQVQLGVRASQQIRREMRVLPSSDVRVQTLRRVARRLLATVDGRNEPWEYTFDVVDDRSVNAFALPGGPVYFNTGILDRMRTEDELAGVLAHELTHIRREHWAYAYRDSQKRNLLFSLGMILFRPSRTVGDLAAISNNLLFDLPFSRQHENQADAEGYDMMVRAGYNPEGMARVFEMLSQQGGGRQPEFFSTHPDSKRRIENIRKRLRESRQDYPAMRPLPW